MYNQWFQQNRRAILASIGALFAIIIVWALWTYADRYGKTPLTVSIVPSSAKVTIDNRTLGGGTHWLKNGTYSITVEQEGFATQKSTLLVTTDKKQNVLAVSLTPVSDEAKKWAAEHERDYSKNEQYGAIEARENGEYFTNKNPITTRLPFNDPYFTIGYRADEDDTVIITIVTPSPRYRFYAVEKIRELGYDPTDFIIEFKDFKNPLGQS